jgi:glutamate dehydrogenase/leucine dehydrogenase
VIAVIDGADAREATALQSELGHEVVAIADASGTVTDRFGIAVWPTTVTLKRDGTISAIAPGGTVRAEAERSQPLREMSTDRNYPRD